MMLIKKYYSPLGRLPNRKSALNDVRIPAVLSYIDNHKKK